MNDPTISSRPSPAAASTVADAREPVAASAENLGLPLPELRRQVEEHLSKLDAALASITAPFGNDPEKTVGLKALRTSIDKVALAYREAFLLRVDQCKMLDEGPWNVEPQILLAPELDLLHEEYVAKSLRATGRWKDLSDILRGMLVEIHNRTAPSEQKATQGKNLEKADHQVRALLAPAQIIIDRLIPLVRSPYNRRENKLVALYGLGAERGAIAQLRPFIVPDQLIFEIARSFAQDKNLPVATGPLVGDSASNERSHNGSKTGSSNGESEGFSRRDLATDLLRRLAAQCSPLLSQGEDSPTGLSPQKRSAVLHAFHQGILGIQSLALSIEPHHELKAIWQGEFLRAVTAAFLILDTREQALVGPILAAQGRALGAI